MINFSFASDGFSDCPKCACITPIFKPGSRTEIKNYRPISILSYLSKLFERCIYRRFYCFIMKFEILTHDEFGFI